MARTRFERFVATIVALSFIALSAGAGAQGAGPQAAAGLPPRTPDRGSGNLVPAVIVGALAIIAIGTLLAREKDPVAQPALPQDQLVERLLKEGPHQAVQFNMSAFAVRGFVRGGWPMLIDFQQRSPGTARMSISARDLSQVFTYELSEVCPPPRRCLIRFQLPPEIFGEQLRPAIIATTATSADGRETQPEFMVYALGAGPRAVGSVAVDQVGFGPPTIRVAEQQFASYRFYSHSDFSNTSVEFWKIDNQNDGSKLSFVDDVSIDGGIHKNQWIGMDERKGWNGMGKGKKSVSAGPHKVQVRAWDQVGDWVTSWSDSIVTVSK